MTSGYSNCACRDCMDVTVSRNTNNPELCELCDRDGCVEWEQGSLAVIAYDCQRDDAYDGDEGCEGHYDSDEALTSGVGIGEPIFCDGSCVTA